MFEDKILKIKNIKHTSTGEPRTDGRYPLRVGCTFNFLFEPAVDECMLLHYEKDNQGNDKNGVLRTSLVTGIEETPTGATITTMNSIYEFECITHEE